MNKVIKPKCIIVDIDQTICNEPFEGDLPQESSRELWDEYHKTRDFYNPQIYKPIQEVVDLIQGYYLSCFIKPFVFFLTARENTCDGKILLNTYRTIRKTFHSFRDVRDFGNKYIVLMRDENDYRSSQEVKQEMLENYVLPCYTPILAFDDDSSNAKMFTDNGITTLQVHANIKDNSNG